MHPLKDLQSELANTCWQLNERLQKHHPVILQNWVFTDIRRNPELNDMESPSTRPSRSSNASQSPASYSSDAFTSQAQIFKRKRSASNQDEESNDDGRKRPSLPRDPPEALSKQLACPYYKRDPIKHLSCFKFTLKRMKDVKQPIQRKHVRPDLYGPVCWRTFYKTSERDEHITERSCLPRDMPASYDSCITSDQQRLISRRADAGLDEVKQWFGLWNILFPGRPEPESPYLGTHLQEIVGTVQHYWNENRHSIVEKVLQARESGPGVEPSTTLRLGQTTSAQETIHQFSVEVFTDTMKILFDDLHATTGHAGRKDSFTSPGFTPNVPASMSRRRGSETSEASNLRLDDTVHNSATNFPPPAEGVQQSELSLDENSIAAEVVGGEYNWVDRSMSALDIDFNWLDDVQPHLAASDSRQDRDQ